MNRQLLSLATCAGLLAGPAAAHPVYTDHIEHRAGLRLDGRNIDLTLEMTFFELRSLAERRLMDRNRDGLIRADEQAAYLAGLRGRIHDQVRLRLDGRDLDLFELYDPELELPGPTTLGEGHHLLKVSLFARRPAWLREGSVVEIESRLWAGGPCLWSLSAEARDDVILERTRVDQPNPTTGPAGAPAVLRGACTIRSCERLAEQQAVLPVQPAAVEPPRFDAGPFPMLIVPLIVLICRRRKVSPLN